VLSLSRKGKKNASILSLPTPTPETRLWIDQFCRLLSFCLFSKKIDQFCGRSSKEPASRVPDVQGKKIVCLLKPPNDAMLTLQSILCSTKCSTQTRCRFVQYAGPYSALKKQGRSGSLLYKMVEHGMPPDQPRSLKRKKN